MVYEAMFDWTRAMDIGPDLSIHLLREYLALWTQVAHVQLNSETSDTIAWAWEANGEYSTRAAYAAKFWGREVMPTGDFTWKCRAPLQCRFFAWFALQNRCWTSEGLIRH